LFAANDHSFTSASNPPDYINNSTKVNLTLKKPNVTIIINSTFEFPQVVYQYTLNNTNASSTEETIVDEDFRFYQPNGNRTIIISQQSINGSANETLVYSPPSVGIVGMNQLFTASLTLNRTASTNKTSVTSSLGISLLQTQMISAASSTIKDTFPFCPQIRYFYVDVPNDGNAYNITLNTDVLNISEVFSTIYLRHGNTPDIENRLYDFREDNVTRLQDSDGYSFGELLYPGKWWFAFLCRSDKPAPDNNQYTFNWDVTAQLTPTCALECFTHGHGTCSGIPAFCNCYTFYSGNNCENLFSGVYVLIVLACILGICLIGATIYYAYRFHQRKQRKLKKLRTDSNIILDSRRESRRNHDNNNYSSLNHGDQNHPHHHHQEHRHKEDRVPLLLESAANIIGE
jgi:hypothetical protein